MEYKINSIKHAGTFGERGTDRIDGRYPMRIGRTVDLSLSKIIIGRPAYLEYLKDSDGSDYSNMTLKTSHVVSMNFDCDQVIIETENSIFELIRCYA